MHLVFGYGTFITKQVYKDKEKVRPAYLPDYFRVYRPQDWFPYVLRDDDSHPEVKSGFWGLLFKVNDEELRNLDIYEGEGRLYRRIKANGLEKNGDEAEFYIYYPMDSTIREMNLHQYVSSGDLWRQKIIDEHPGIIQDYPQLKRKSFLK